MRKSLLSLIFFCSVAAVFANETAVIDEQKFSDANFYFFNEDYEKAIPIYTMMYKLDTTNFNIAYRLGVCYVNTPLKLFQSIPYLKKALTQTSIKYNEESSKERNAPLETYYYLGRAYQLTREFDKAIELYDYFVKQTVKKERQLTEPSKKGIAACKVAKELYKTPQKVEISNVGKTINSEFYDINPCVTRNDSMLFYTVRTKRNTSVDDITLYRFQIMYSKKQPDGLWSRPVDITNQINSKGTAQTISVSSDGKTLFLYRDDYYYGSPGDVSKGNIYVSRFEKGKWTAMSRFTELNSLADDVFASISDNGKTIYLVSDRKGGLGGFDLYRSDLDANGKWKEPVNMGSTVNTPGDESAPIAIGDSVLYFASDGHGTIGGMDIFKCVFGAQKKLSAPINLGVPINSPGDESLYVPVLNGTAAYFFTARPDGYISFGGTDIYNIILDPKN